MTLRLARVKAISLVAHLLFWAAICLTLYCLNRIVLSGLGYGGSSPIPVRVNPRLLTLAIEILPVLALISLATFYFSFVPRAFVFILQVSVALLPTGLFLSSMYPGSGSVVSRDLVETLPPSASQSVFAFPVFFSNASSELTTEEKSRLVDAFSVFRFCEAGTLMVRGFASSATFANKTSAQSDLLNLELANKRAEIVRDTLNNLVGASATAVVWGAFGQMASERRLRDQGFSGERLLAAESLNRRVEIFWNDSNCVGIGKPQESDKSSFPPVANAAPH